MKYFAIGNTVDFKRFEDTQSKQNLTLSSLKIKLRKPFKWKMNSASKISKLPNWIAKKANTVVTYKYWENPRDSVSRKTSSENHYVTVNWIVINWI